MAARAPAAPDASSAPQRSTTSSGMPPRAAAPAAAAVDAPIPPNDNFKVRLFDSRVEKERKESRRSLRGR